MVDDGEEDVVDDGEEDVGLFLDRAEGRTLYKGIFCDVSIRLVYFTECSLFSI